MQGREWEHRAFANIDSAMQIRTLPGPSEDWALFLDIDGTLLDIAEQPGGVVVPRSLPPLLTSIRARLGGALALVSGRRLADIDRLMAPAELPCAAEHGACLRLADGSVHSVSERNAVPEILRRRLHSATRTWPGVFVEDKRFNVAVHFRQAPSFRDQVERFMHDLADEAGNGFEVLSARQSFELRHRSSNKGDAVRRFMTEPTFSSRRPVFVGDDVTDEDGFVVALELGGLALDVRVQFDGRPARVREWLASFQTDAPMPG